MSPIDISKAAARILLRSGAISINTEKPFIYASGIISPIYADNRLLLAYSTERRYIVALMQELIRTELGRGPFDYTNSFNLIAGVATAGIPWASLLANYYGCPLVYVREAVKEHGKRQRVEGLLQPRGGVLVVDDLASTGRSIVAAAEALREAGSLVSDCLAIFTYQLPQAAATLAAHALTLHTLTTVTTVLDMAVGLAQITIEQRQTVEDWLESKAHIP